MSDTKKFEELKHKTVDNGGYFVHFYFDMHANDRENLKNIMIGFVGKITKESGVAMVVGEIEDPIENDGTFSTTAHVSMLVTSFGNLVRLTQTYTPIAIEVEEPFDAKIDAGELQRALMGISMVNQELTQHILTKTMTDEQKKQFEKQMGIKAQFGRQLRKEAEEGKDSANEKK